VFTLPTLDGLKADELQKILDDALKAHGDIAKIKDEDLTDEQLEELETITAAIATVTEAQTATAAAAEERAARIAAAKAASTPAEGEGEGEGEGETDAEAQAAIDAEVAATDVPNDAAELEQEAAVVASAAPSGRSAVRGAASKAPAVKRPVAPKPERPKATIHTVGESSAFGSGAELPDMKAVAEAFLGRSRSMPQRKLAGLVSQHTPVASFAKATRPEFTLVAGDQQGNFDKINDAARGEDGSLGNIVAAGGWCAPSETIYDIPQLATVSGILNLAEVSVPRGGLSFTKGPSFEQIYADAGFLQTEAQAEAGVLKNFIDVECPGFEEVRLDAIGFGVRAGILTNKAWPELVRHYLDETLVAHAHKKNASMIQRIVALSGSPITAGGIGSVASDMLDALALQATRLRYKYRLGETARIEGMAPLWLLEVARSDFAYREDIGYYNVTDAQINGWLAARNIYLQWVYDWQDLAGSPFETGTSGNAKPWPTEVEVDLWPSGAFVAGTEDVISLDIVHDTASLAANTFTAAFFEEAIMVFNPKANGIRVSIPVARPAGRTGAHNLTNGFVARPAISA